MPWNLLPDSDPIDVDADDYCTAASTIVPDPVPNADLTG